MNTPLLDKIQSPADLALLKEKELALLCRELRGVITDSVSRNGGHLASNLGTVELTVCLERVFSRTEDRIVFDVGHQCYTHKLLTGRRAGFENLRKKGGAAGFPRPDESDRDAFVGGHSSTSVSVALGLAAAKRLRGEDGEIIAVIGDGAMTGGQFFEALNNIASSHAKVVVVVNDNEMSISPNIGGISEYLSKLTSRRGYFAFKDRMERLLKGIPVIGEGLFRCAVGIRDGVKRLVAPPTIFNDMGIAYIGPVDGHDIRQLLTVFERAKKLNKSVVVHCRTVKGKGFTPAENDPCTFHSTAPFEVETGARAQKNADFSAVFGQTLCEMAQQDSRICAVSASMVEGTGLTQFCECFPDRLFDVAIAEQHAATFSAALAKGGMRPYFAVYSSFLQRAYDQIIHDIAISGLPVVLCVDRAGFVGADGETHHGLFDIAYLSSVPGMTVYSPSSFEELRLVLKNTLSATGPTAVRYPRGGEEPSALSLAPDREFLLQGDGGSDALIVTYGSTVGDAAEAVKQLSEKGACCDLLKLVRVHPVPQEAVKAALNYRHVFFFEEAVRSGSVGAAFAEQLCSLGFSGSYRHAAVEDCFVSHDSVTQQRRQFGLDARGICDLISEVIL